MQVLNASEVRKDFSRFIDQVVHERPIVFKRNRDKILSLSTEQINALLEEVKFKADLFNEEDGSVTMVLEGFDLVVNGLNQEQTFEKMAEELVDYAQDYFEQFVLYSKSPNRKKHFPYVLKVALSEDIPAIVRLINA
ncbi:MAG: hypothetical protein WC147_05545 [Syntrophomonas sp.]